MTEPTHMPSAEHEQFDEICSRVADFEPLPAVVIEPQTETVERELDSEDEPLDGLILAGLVTPY
jgi:hypothetical protein